MIKHILAVMFTLFMIQNQARAEILFEPYVGYETGTFTYKYKTPTARLFFPDTYKDTITGTAYGARLAYGMSFFFLGLDGNLFTGTKKIDSKSGQRESKSELTGTTIYALVGLSFNALRLWYGHGLSDEVKYKSGGDEGTLTHSAMKIGLGYRLLPHLSINAEYHSKTQMDITEDNNTIKSEDFYESNKYTAYVLSLSFPLSF